jgi:hypothetical protein
MMNKYKLRILLSVALVVLAGVIAIAIEYHPKKATPIIKQVVQTALKEPEIHYDPLLLNKFKELTEQLDFNKPNYTYAGAISMIDGKDSTHTVSRAKFLFSRTDKDYYYQMDNMETIHQHGINVFVQKEQKKVVLSARDVPVKSLAGSLQLLQKSLQDESYRLVSKTAGSTKTLSLLNDTHISCKELSVTYDTLANRIQKINMRLSDFNDPLNKKKDRLVELMVTRMEDMGRPSRYMSVSDVVYQQDGKWKLTEKYAQYELIIL